MYADDPTEDPADPATPRLRAIAYVRDMTHLEVCQQYCERHGHRLVGVVPDQDGHRWQELLDEVIAGAAEVIVVRRRVDVPTNAVPRVEVAADAAARAETTPRRRRPRRRGDLR